MAKKAEAPNGVKLEVTALIDRDMWAILRNQGFSEKDLIETIKKSITFNRTACGVTPKVPLFDIMDVDLLKYY